MATSTACSVQADCAGLGSEYICAMLYEMEGGEVA